MTHVLYVILSSGDKIFSESIKRKKKEKSQNTMVREKINIICEFNENILSKIEILRS